MADYSKNFTKISESILSSDNEEGEAMTSQKVKGLNDKQIYYLLCRIDKGYSVTEAEKIMLSSVINISWNGRDYIELPNSIRKLTSLSELDLSGTQVSDISALSKLTSLSKLNLNDTEVSEISALSKLTSLSTLYLSGTQASDISALSKLTSLSELYLSGTQVSEISALSKLTSLSELDLSNTKVSDISALSKLTSLSKLDLSGTEVTDISALSKLTSLSELCLSSTEVSDISALSNLTLLSDLCLGNTQLKVEGYKKISVPVLFKYYTSFATFSSSSGKIFMVKRYKYGTQIRDISALSKLTSLLRLDLEGTKVNDISALSNLKNLETLNLGGLEINDLDAISGLTALKQLNLQNSKTTRIPESILDLDIGFIIEEINPFPKSHDKGVFIHGLTLTDQPIEVFSQSRELLRAYYRERNRGPVNECKVIFLGDAESGKTHSIRRLLKKGEYLKDEDFDGKSTPGRNSDLRRTQSCRME